MLITRTTIRTLLLSTVLSVLTNMLWAQSDTLRLVFTGDIMGHTPQIKSAATGKGTYDYMPCFKYVKPILERADLAIGNLELTLPGKPPYTGYPMFRSPDALATALKESGFDILCTANNHSNDAHGLGVRNTIETLRNNDFLQTGTFKDEDERRIFYPLIVYKNGFKLAFVNYTYDTNGVPDELPTIVNRIDTVQMAADLENAKARNPDYIIAVMHWGIEYQLKENEEQRRLAKFLIKNGADIIIGMHPHVVQPIKRETAVAPDGKRKEALVVYSLGNFISNQTQPNTDGGIMFEMELVKKKGSKRAELNDYGFIPVWRYIHHSAGGKTTYYTMPVAKMERNPDLVPGFPESVRSKMKASVESIRKRLVCPEKG